MLGQLCHCTSTGPFDLDKIGTLDDLEKSAAEQRSAVRNPFEKYFRKT